MLYLVIIYVFIGFTVAGLATDLTIKTTLDQKPELTELVQKSIFIYRSVLILFFVVGWGPILITYFIKNKQ